MQREVSFTFFSETLAFRLIDVPYRVRCTTYLSKDDGEKIVVGSTDAVSFLFTFCLLQGTVCLAETRRAVEPPGSTAADGRQ